MNVFMDALRPHGRGHPGVEFHPMEHPATVQVTQEEEQRASGDESTDESFHLRGVLARKVPSSCSTQNDFQFFNFPLVVFFFFGDPSTPIRPSRRSLSIQ